MNDKFFGMLGLCAKAGKIMYGAYACDKGIKSRKIKLLLIDDTASDNTIKEFENACEYYKIPVIINKADRKLGMATGKPANKIFGIICPMFSTRLIQISRDTISGGV